MTELELKERQVLDLDDPEQLAEAVMLGAVQAFEVSPARLARLGQAHTELLAHQRAAADAAQATTNELEAAREELIMLRAIHTNLLAQAFGQQAAGQDAPDRLLAIAITVARDPHDVIGLLLATSVNACLVAAAPRGALQAGLDVFGAAIADIAGFDAAAAGQERERPS